MICITSALLAFHGAPPVGRSTVTLHGAAPVGRSTIQMAAKPVAKLAPKPKFVPPPPEYDYSDALGVIAPTGFFDPLNLSSNIDQDTFDQYRTAELKHGRVAQLAVIGYIVPEFFRWPGEIAPGITFASIPNGVAAIDAIPSLGWAQMIFLIGAVDYWGFLGDFDIGKPDLDEEELEKRKLNELQHGRLAMIAILELLRHDSQNLVKPMFDGLDHLITGLPFLYN